MRNNFDGAVEVLAMGSEHQLKSFSAKVNAGPRAARVDAVEETAAAPVEGLSSFRIEGAW